MKSNLFLQVIIVIFILFAGFDVKAKIISPENAVLWAEDKGKILLNTFQEKDISVRNKKLDNILDDYVDIPYIAKFLVGRYWREMTNSQRQECVNVFQRYVKALYKTFPLDFVSQIKYRVVGAVPDKNFVIVNTIITLDANANSLQQEIMLAFRLHADENNIRLVDIKVAESSLLLSYRNKFTSMLASVDGEIDWFLEDLEDMITSVEKINSENEHQL